MSNEDMTPSADKWLHADGSVTTLAGIPILPADQNRAQDYASRMAAADKWLHPDGSVTDSAGALILEADASRAQDYESRMPGVGGVFFGKGGSDDFHDDGFVFVQPFIRQTEDTITTAPAVCTQDAMLVFFPWIETAELITEQYNISDTASAELS